MERRYFVDCLNEGSVSSEATWGPFTFQEAERFKEKLEQDIGYRMWRKIAILRKSV